MIKANIDENNAIKSIQKHISNWIGLEALLESEIRHFGNLINESSYVQPDILYNTFDEVITPSRITIPANLKLFEKFTVLEKTSNQMNNELESVLTNFDKLQSLTLSASSSSDGTINKIYNVIDTTVNSETATAAATGGCVELSFIEILVNQVKQQTLLEVCIVSNIRDKISKEWNASGIGSGSSGSGDSSAQDQNELTTWLACFEYKPYLDEAALSRFMSTKI